MAAKTIDLNSLMEVTTLNTEVELHFVGSFEDITFQRLKYSKCSVKDMYGKFIVTMVKPCGNDKMKVMVAET